MIRDQVLINVGAYGPICSTLPDTENCKPYNYLVIASLFQGHFLLTESQ